MAKKETKGNTMIDSVKRIATVKAIDLPPTFDIRIGTRTLAIEVENVDAHFVYLRHAGETMYVRHDDMLTILVPDTWDNAAIDIEFALMQEGAL